MYKRYLEPNDNIPLTKYMAKKLKESRNLKVSNSSNEIVSSNYDVTSDITSIQVHNNIEEETENNISRGGEFMQFITENIQLEDSDIRQANKNDCDEFFHSISDQLIHPNLHCKTADAIVMILAYFLQHHLTWVALEDLLELFHNVLGDESNLPKTKYFFKKCFGQNQRAIFHFYCKKCFVYINTYENIKSLQDEKSKNGDKICDSCNVCGSECSLKKMNEGHFFVQLPLRDQIEKIVSENGDILHYDTNSNSSDIRDIFDGELYKSRREKIGTGPLITLTLNTDGVKVFKSKRKASLWPIQMFINEVPPNKRLKLENIILTGIWFGKDPIFELYFKPLTAEMKDLDDRKIIVNTNSVNETVTVRLLLISADSPAKAKILKTKQYNGKFGCPYCLHPGVQVGDNISCKYPVSSEKYSLRTHSSTVALMNLFLSTGKESCGIIGISPLLGFKDYDLTRGTIIDYLHCVLEGVTNLLLDLWFDSINHREKYYVTPRGREVVNKNLKAITPLKTFSIKPRSIEEREFWKAHELKYWLLFYAVPCLTGTMKSVYLNHFTLLSEGIFIFLKSKITPRAYQKASENLIRFTREFQILYGEDNMMSTVHLLEHLPKCVKDCGPLWCYSNFNFEGNNGSLVRHVNGTTDVEHQIVSKYSLNTTLASLKRKLEPSFNYIDRMKSMRVKKSEKIGQITVFGRPHKHKLGPHEKNILLADSDYIMAYYKFFYCNDVYFSATYKRAEQTNDTIVSLKDQRIGEITLIFMDKGVVSILLKILKVEAVPQFPIHIKKICKNIVDEFVIVSAEEVSQKLLLISTVNEKYLSELPNQFEGD